MPGRPSRVGGRGGGGLLSILDLSWEYQSMYPRSIY